MPKLFDPNKNVLEAARERLDYIYSNYEQSEIFMSCSAGKDSTVLFYLCLEAARKHGKLPLKVLTIDLEANYKLTLDMMEHVLLHPDVEPYWLCLPFGYRNGVSYFEPFWVAWDPAQKDKWVRPMPTHDCVITSDNNPFVEHGWRDRMRPSQFYGVFAKYVAHHSGGRAIAINGIRADESLNRFRVLFANKEMLEGHRWTTRMGRKGHTYNAYPIYDWRVEDVWKYTHDCGQPYNRIYDRMLLAGKTIHQMRVCQPFGDEQKAGLDLYHLLEPETWHKVVMRVSGANTGARYRGSSFNGIGRIQCPEGLNWKEYYELIMASLPESLREHYARMTGVTVSNWIKKGKVRPTDGVVIKAWEDIDPEFASVVPGAPSYKRFCKMILSNDFMGHTLKFCGRKHEYDNYAEGIHENRRKPSAYAVTTEKPNPIKEKYKAL
jgi:predicted phosphoadenosine phosphosulfate sulfurtransferase